MSKSNISILSFISENTEIKDNSIRTKDDIRINGKLIADIESSSIIVVGEKAVISGTITGQRVDVEGKVTGEEIIAKECITLRSTSNVSSKLTTPQLIIEVGAIYNGSCSMETENEKQKK